MNTFLLLIGLWLALSLPLAIAMGTAMDRMNRLDD